MAQKPDGKAARTERVTFTRPAAERIAKVVRTVERGNRDCGGLTFERVSAPAAGKVFRMCTFTGTWSKNTVKVVTFRGVTSTPNTAQAVNVFANLGSGTATRNCAIARDGTAWYVIAAEC